MAKQNYLALLRGINVGGNNIIKMTDLKTTFVDMGFSDVSTYIQSGNVIFKSEIDNKTSLINLVEKNLSDRFGYLSKVVIINHNELKSVVENAPEGYGLEPANYRYDVLFLKDPLTVIDFMKKIKLKTDVDEAFPGKITVYFRRLIKKASSSYLTRVITLPEYKFITIRNWNTTTKLLTMMNAN
jgi:uncharacterized protein (DUF1697 family)